MNIPALQSGRRDSLWFQFWYLDILRFYIGIAQLVAVVWCFVILVRDGINPRTMKVAFIGVGLTSMSLLLFRILKRVK